MRCVQAPARRNARGPRRPSDRAKCAIGEPPTGSPARAQPPASLPALGLPALGRPPVRPCARAECYEELQALKRAPGCTGRLAYLPASAHFLPSPSFTSAKGFTRNNRTAFCHLVPASLLPSHQGKGHARPASSDRRRPGWPAIESANAARAGEEKESRRAGCAPRTERASARERARERIRRKKRVVRGLAPGGARAARQPKRAAVFSCRG